MNLRSGWTLVEISACAAVFGLAASVKVSAADHPRAEITNGQIRLTLYLPDAKDGFYRGTRFDWSGVIGSLQYQGHDFYGPWFKSVDPNVHDYRYDGSKIIASTCSGAVGPVEEFQTHESALGWDEAKVGGTFIKIGVGVLRKDESKYDFVKQYEIVDAGKWEVRKHHDSVEFTQRVFDPRSGYGYVYKKTVRLVEGEPEMVLEHSLKNTGHRTIESTVYNHNFLVLDKQAPGPDFSIEFPFPIHSSNPPKSDLAEIRGNQMVYLKTLANRDLAMTPVEGFGDSPEDNEIRIENRKIGAGMTIKGDHPLSSVFLWSIRTVLAVEPFIAMKINPGDEFKWKDSYRYYTLPSKPR